MSTALLALAVLAPCALLASELPHPAAWPLAVAALAWGLRDARRYRRRAPIALVVPVGRDAVLGDGQPLHGMQVHWRGPLARLEWSDPDGVRQRRLFWPDTLDARARRELRLAMMRREAAPGVRSVAG